MPQLTKTSPRKKNYLNTKDMLIEINKSKLSYCWVKDPQYRNCDVMICDFTELDDDEVIADGIRTRKSRMATESYNQRLSEWENKKTKSNKTKPRFIDSKNEIGEITKENLVIRVFDSSHIDPKYLDKKAVKKIAKHNRLKFRPFKHYAWNADQQKYIEVVRSFWNGDLTTGHFDCNHGCITDKLAKMIMILAKKYSNLSRYAFYTYKDDMVGNAIYHLTANSLLFDESKSKTPNPFAYYTSIINNAFNVVLNNEKKQSDIKDRRRLDSGLEPSFNYIDRHCKNTETHMNDFTFYATRKTRSTSNSPAVTKEVKNAEFDI